MRAVPPLNRLVLGGFRKQAEREMENKAVSSMVSASGPAMNYSPNFPS